MIDAALEHSGHKLRTRGLLAMLTNGSRFDKEKSFEELNPVYDITPYDIQEYVKQNYLIIKNQGASNEHFCLVPVGSKSGGAPEECRVNSPNLCFIPIVLTTHWNHSNDSIG